MHRFVSWRRLLALVSLGGAVSSAVAEPHRPVQLGTCRVGDDVAGTSELTVDLCLKARAGVEAELFAGTPDEHAWLRYGRGYAGLHLTRWLSLHTSGWVRERELFEKEEGARPHREAVPDYSIARFGNPGVHPYRLTVGRVRIPFGVDLNDAVESIRRLENREFWATPRYGATVAIDNRLTSMIEIGYGTDGKRRLEGTPGEPLNAASLRYSYDVSILDGSRLVASLYADEEGRRRYGAAFVTVSAQGDMTHFEFVRLLTTPDGKAEPFRQLLRLSYVTAYRANTRWLITIDDERDRYRLGMLGHDLRLLPHLLGRLALTYRKSEAGDGAHRWSLSTGLEASL